MLVPTREFDQITDNALLNKAGRLAAESNVIFQDKSIPDSFAIQRIKPLARERGRLTKRIRQIGPLSSNIAGVSDEEDEEEGALVNVPLETMFKQFIKSASRGGKKKLQVKKEKTPVQPSTSGVKKKPPPSKIPIAVSQRRNKWETKRQRQTQEQGRTIKTRTCKRTPSSRARENRKFKNLFSPVAMV